MEFSDATAFAFKFIQKEDEHYMYWKTPFLFFWLLGAIIVLLTWTPCRVETGEKNSKTPVIPLCQKSFLVHLALIWNKKASLRSEICGLCAVGLRWEGRERQRLCAIKGHFMLVSWRHKVWPRMLTSANTIIEKVCAITLLCTVNY